MALKPLRIKSSMRHLNDPQRRTSLTWLAAAFLSGPLLNAQAKSLEELPKDGIELVFPRLADTGNSVPLQIRVTAALGLHVRSLKIILPENPNPMALQLNISGQPVQYQMSTRLRLAASQSVWVVAQFSDGSEHANSAPTVITSTACLDDA
jgi:predicted secreted protein